MASGFLDEPSVGPRIPDPALCGARGVLRALVFEPVRARGRGGRMPARGYRGVRRVVGPDRVRLVVPAQNEDAAMKKMSIRVGIARALMTAVILIGGSSSVFACPVCFGALETGMIDGAKLGVLVLLGITLAVQGAFLAFFLYLRKNAKRNAELELDAEWLALQRPSRTSS